MNRENYIKDSTNSIFHSLKELEKDLNSGFQKEFNRNLPFNEVLFDRWDRANELGFGANSSIYNLSLVFGDVKVGKNTWIGPFTIIDGSGGLEIGDSCTISSGVQIYTHDNVKQTLSGGSEPIERAKVTIGNKTYIGPNCVISKGVSIGSQCVLATNSFLNKSMESGTIYAGTPAKKIGEVQIVNNHIQFVYLK